MIPITRSPYSFFEPSWEVGKWSDFSDFNFKWQNQYRSMERQMKEMEKHMDDMFGRFGHLTPIDHKSPAPIALQHHRPLDLHHHEKWNIENPYITDKDGSHKLKLSFDVRQFKPEEISVKTSDQQLTVHAKHQEDTSNSKVYREYHRQFLLPPTVKPESLKSVLSPEGVLSIEAPVEGSLPSSQPKVVPIEHSKSKPAIK